MQQVAQHTAALPHLDAGDPAADSRAFRRCLGQYPTGVTVISASLGGRPVGMAVNSFAAVSLSPALVLWSLRRESRSLADFLEASHFAVNVLAADQVQVSQLFGSGHPDRFELAGWRPGASGAPLLHGALAHLECRRQQVLDGGDHVILIGEVERYARFDGQPLVFSQGQYAVSQNHPQLNQSTAPAPDAPTAGAVKPPFLRLLSVASQRMSASFDEHRRALGLTVGSTRVLSRLREAACSIEALEQATYLGPDAFADTLADLIANGDVMRQPGGWLELTPAGQAKSDAVALRSVQFTREKLQGIPEADIAAARRVFDALRQR